MASYKKAQTLANALLQSGALKFGSFKLKSGIISPYYIDLSWLLSSPESFNRIVEAVVEKARELLSSIKVDKLATVELKGALLLPSIASRLNMPAFVVRKESKTYGLTGRIAGGQVRTGDHILFFDDVVTDAGSKIESMKPMEHLGGEIVAVLVVVDREQGGRQKLESMGYKLYSVTTISEIVKDLSDSRDLSEEQVRSIQNYLKQYSDL